MITSHRPLQPEDSHELESLRHENARLRKTLSLRGRLEELVVDNNRLRQALNQYGRHTHPHCHDIVAGTPRFSDPALCARHPCLCGLDEACKENPGG